MTEYPAIAIIMCLILGAFIIFAEIKRPQKARLLWRVAASLIAVTSLYFMLFPISYEVKKTGNHVLHFLSSGALSLDSLPSGVELLTADPKVSKGAKAKVKTIPDLDYYLKTHPEISNIHLYGYGLAKEQLQQLKDYELSFHAAATPEGIIYCNWPQTVNSREKLRIQGTYQHSGSKPVKLISKGLGLHLDSTVIAGKGTSRFSFEAKAAFIGKAVFNLLALQGKDTLANEPVPFEVLPAPPVKVMIMASYPDFEHKFLKNWLSDNHYPVIFRARISKEKYSTDFLNTAIVPMSRLNRQVLKQVDFLIIDEEMLQALSGAERTAIDLEIAAGMGMLVRNDETAVKVKPGPNIKSVYSTDDGKVLIDSRMQGRGRVLNSTAPATYTWLLEGRDVAYASFWTSLITEGARKEQKPFSLEMQPRFPVAGQRTRLLIEQQSAGRPQIDISQNKLALRQNIVLPFQWDGFFWPDTAGWEDIKVAKASQSFYVFDDQDWKALRLNSLRDDNLAFFAESKQHKRLSTKSVSTTETIPLWWFFALFLMSAGYLWFEARFLRNKLN